MDELLKLLRRRSHVLDAAVVVSALAGGLTCATVLVLFLSEIRAMDVRQASLLELRWGDSSDSGLAYSVCDRNAACSERRASSC